MRFLPVDFAPDWPRKVANTVRDLINAVTALQAKTGFDGLGDYADDAAAEAGGVAIGSLYRNGSVLQVRVT